MIKVKEVFCRSILSPSKIPGCDYVINPYVGCQHSCVWCLHPDTLILTQKGFIRVENLFNQKKNNPTWETVSHKGKVCKINNYFKHPYNGDLVKIRPSYFDWLRLTPNHKVFTLKREKINLGIRHIKQSIKPELVPAGELRRGDFILAPIPRQTKNINVLLVEKILGDIKARHKIGRKLSVEIIRKIFDLREKGFSTRKIGAKLKISSTAVANYLSGRRSKRREFNVGLLRESSFLRFKGGKTKIPAIITLSKSFLRLAGYYLSEGWVSVSKSRPNSAQVCFTFNVKEKDYIADVKNLMGDIFGVKFNEVFRERDKAITLSCGVNIIAFLFAVLFGKTSVDKKIPPQFLFLPVGKQKELLKGLFRGDGTVTTRKESKARPVCFVTTSENLKNSVQLMLLRCGILSGISISRFGKKRKNKAFIIAPASQYQQQFADLFGTGARVKNGKNLYGTIVKNKWAIVPIRLIEKEKYNGPVFNLSVEKDHSYIANFIGVSNCYARFMKGYTGHDNDEWGSFVDVKINAPEALVKDIRKLNDSIELKDYPTIFFSSVCDPYQPIEAKYQLTRKCLEILSNFPFPISILTQSKLVTRDIDLFKKFKSLEVGMSFITMDEKATRIFQPAASLPKERIETLKKLHQAGLKTYLHVGPILPLFTNFEVIFKAVSPWVDSVMGETLNTRGENWTSLIKTLSFYYPKLLPEFKKWKFQNPEYLCQVKSDFKKVAQKHKIRASEVYTHGQN